MGTSELLKPVVELQDESQRRARRPVVVLGDLNDVPEAATTQILLGPPGSQPGTRAFGRADDGDSARMFNLANFIPLERRYSRVNNGVRELIDHILVSEDWLPERREPAVDALVDLFGNLPSVGENPKVRRGEEVPDHAPVTAELELR